MKNNLYLVDHTLTIKSITLMAQNKYALARYYIIDGLLHKYKYVKTSLIVESCREKTGYSVSLRTIQLDIEAMKNDSFLGFYAPISYCNKRKAYYYTQSDYRLTPFTIGHEEVKEMEIMLDDIDDKINRDQYRLMRQIIDRMKLFSLQ